MAIERFEPPRGEWVGPHATIWVSNQQSARDFYTHKLGFQLLRDEWRDGRHWVVVGLSTHPRTEIALIEPRSEASLGPAATAQLQCLMQSGHHTAGVLLTEDCVAAHAELAARGVGFVEDPHVADQGLEAVLLDDSGNRLILRQTMN